MRVRIYAEGGGDSRELKIRCRQGFSRLFEKAGLRGRMPRVLPCGSRGKAFEDFCVALGSVDFLVLLIDSEGPVSGEVWAHLPGERPSGVTRDQVHLMVQAMESWFLSDRSALKEFYGRGFREGVLPKRKQVEAIAKKDVLSAMAAATKDTSKGRYSKGDHSYQILGLLDPAEVEERAPHAKRLFTALREKC